MVFTIIVKTAPVAEIFFQRSEFSAIVIPTIFKITLTITVLL
jgi:hypothetical protein